ncbi:MAG TPA: cytochrome c biogenesis protein CcsA [Gemmatimonadaceae bacterium]|nr:cytochrome c biogenesis protein CcsA [Gemmatimonadaceae bacterium]
MRDVAIVTTESSIPSGSLHPAAFRSRGVEALGAVALVALVGAQLLAILVSPPDRDMGHLQKIMYVHVPAAWNAFVAFFVVAVSSLLYLWRRNERHDLLAASAAEVGAVLTGLTLVLGSIWGRPTWGVWWTWDPRLTSTAVLFLIFVGYLSLRAFVEDPERRAQWSAAVGLLGALNVPIVYMSVRWWRTLHQTQSSPSTVDPQYVLGLRANAIAFLLVLIYFVYKRYRAALLEREVERLNEIAALGNGGAHAR